MSTLKDKNGNTTYVGDDGVKMQSGKTLRQAVKDGDIGGGGSDIEIVDNLNSTDATKVLSAKQGKVLNDSKQGKLVAGDNITINGNVISATDGSSRETSNMGNIDFIYHDSNFDETKFTFGSSKALGHRDLLTFANKTSQSAALYKDTLFVIDQCSLGWVSVVDMKSMKIIDYGQYIKSSIDSHNGCASFGTTFYEDGDDYPLLYLGRTDSPVLDVYRVQQNDGVHSFTLVQSITFPDDAYFPVIYIDNDRSCLWVMNCYTDSYSAGTKYIIRKYPIPSVTDGDVTYTEADELTDRKEVAFTSTAQDGCIYNGILYQTCLLTLCAIDLENGTKTNLYYGSSWNDKTVYDEFEGMVVYNDTLYTITVNSGRTKMQLTEWSFRKAN